MAGRRMTDGYGLLSEKEKETLRLILRGYDAKTMARHLDLSVHTINERLRQARRKLAVPSSREAARLLLETECPDHDLLAGKRLGEDLPGETHQRSSRHKAGISSAMAIGGLAIMTLVLAAVAIAALGLGAAGQDTTSRQSAYAISDLESRSAAENWLALVDADRWDESYRETGSAFRELNTSDTWVQASEQARMLLGTVETRVFISEESVPTPPLGHRVVRFRSSFSNRPDVTETLSLAREDGAWKVVGYVIG